MTSRWQNIFFFLFATVVLSGCEGIPGSPGANLLPEDRRPPSVDIVLPLAGKQLYSQCAVEAIILDDDSISGYDFLVDGVPDNSAFSVRRAPSLWTWDLALVSTGWHHLQLVAWDATGKRSASSLLRLYVSDQQTSGKETLRYYSDSTGVAATHWNLPADSSGLFAGLGTRFTPDRACLLKSVSVKLYRKADWAGTTLYLDIFTEENGLPDSLIYRKVISLRRLEAEVFDDWTVSSFRSGLPIDGEFFAVVTLSEDAEGDTLAIQSDDGGWTNGHGLMKTLDGNWTTFNVGRGRKPNPLIFAVVEY